MKRRDFIQKSTFAGAAFTTSLQPEGRAEINKEIYELRIYELRWNQAPLDEYLSKALIPALNRIGVKKVGAFTEIGKSEPVKLYLLIAYESFVVYGNVMNKLRLDPEFQKASEAYNSIPVDQSVFTRFESSLMVAFDGLPKLIAPKNEPRIFELRTYEGYNEDAVARKIRMFNEAEFTIFNRTKLNPVFFGEQIVGKNLPCLTYMITFKDMEERDKNWAVFGQDAEWQKIKQAPEFANTVSKIHKTFLLPLPYSQL